MWVNGRVLMELDMEVSRNGGYPKAGWFLQGKVPSRNGS